VVGEFLVSSGVRSKFAGGNAPLIDQKIAGEFYSLKQHKDNQVLHALQVHMDDLAELE
jgi:hypothetical protein